MTNGSDLKKERRKTTTQISPDYLDQFCDRGLVVGMPAPRSAEGRVSIIFSRQSISPLLTTEKHTAPFEVVISNVATISMNTAAARKMAEDILRATDAKAIEEAELVGDDGNEG